MDRKYFELDKQISNKIMPEFKDMVIRSECPYCRGVGHAIVNSNISFCSECAGYGFIDYEY